MRRKNSRNVRPQLLDLELRVTPAIDLAINGDTATDGVTVTATTVDGITTTTFKADTTGATLNPATIALALQDGDVVITTDDGGVGAEAGNITWDRTSNDDDLDTGFIFANRLLTFSTINSEAAAGAISVTNGVSINGNFDVGFKFVTNNATGTDGGADLSGASLVGRSLEMLVGTETAKFGDVTLDGNATITADDINPVGGTFFASTGEGSTVAFNGAYLTPATGVTVVAANGGVITFNGEVTGAGNLTLEAGAINFTGGNVELTGTAILAFDAGNVSFGANNITAPKINVGSIFNFVETNFGAGTGTVTGNVEVFGSGNLTPGGVGAVGTLNIVGNVIIGFDGSYDPDLGATPDVLNITGDLNLSVFSNLGNVGGGTITGSKDIVTLSGAITGNFGNAALNQTLLLGLEAVKITAYTSGPGGKITIEPVAVNLKSFTGHDDDGTAYTAKLAGPGGFVVVPALTGKPSFLLKGTNSTSTLTITTKANGSNNILAAGQFIVTDPLNAVNAATADFSSRVTFGQTVKSVTVRDVLGKVTIGGTGTSNTTLKARTLNGGVASGSNLGMLTASSSLGGIVSAPKIGPVIANFASGSITATTGSIGTVSIGLSQASLAANAANTGAIGAIKVGNSVGGTISTSGAIASITSAGDFTSSVSAASVGAVKIGVVLSDSPGGTGWNVSGPVASIAAGGIGQFGSFNFTARNLGTLTVTGNAHFDVDADIQNSTFTLNGNEKGATAAAAVGTYGIKSVTVAGNVLDSDFFLKEGSITLFKAARFINSGLYLDYTPGTDPGDTFDTAGTFDSATKFKIGTFTLTATTLGTPLNRLNYAFADSEIVANSLGTIRLPGVGANNGLESFGVKYKFNAAEPATKGSVRVASGLTGNNGTADLTPDTTVSYSPIQDDFYYIGV